MQKTVLLGRDPEALRILFEVHAPPSPRILDVTHNKGTMWEGTGLAPVRSDIDPTQAIDLAADFGALPFRDGSFDVIVYDPPHLPVAAASVASSKMWERRYGITNAGQGRTGDNIIGMFAPFLVEARRVLVPGGLVFAKLADLIHNHRYQWHQVDFVIAVRQAGMTACDMLIKADPSAGNLRSSKWQTVHHLRKAHSYWLVVRNSTRCER